MGIEPTPKAWEAFVLPLNYTRNCNLPTQPRGFFARSGVASRAGPCSALRRRPMLKLGKLSFCH